MLVEVYRVYKVEVTVSPTENVDLSQTSLVFFLFIRGISFTMKWKHE